MLMFIQTNDVRYILSAVCVPFVAMGELTLRYMPCM